MNIISDAKQTEIKGQKGRPRRYYSLKPSVKQALGEPIAMRITSQQDDSEGISLLFPRLQIF